MAFGLAVLLAIIFLPCIYLSEVLYWDKNLETSIKILLEQRFKIEEDKRLLLSRPVFNLDPSLYNPFSPTQDNNPLKSWNALIDKIPTFYSQSVFFEDAPKSTSLFWNYFLQNYEWSDVEWQFKKCKVYCQVDLLRTEAEISKLETLITQVNVDVQNCKDSTSCISINNQLVSIYTNQLNSLKQRYNDERSKLIALESDNYDSKVFQNLKRIAKAKSSDSKEFYTVNFEPVNFAEILFNSNPLFLDSLDVQNWDSLKNFSFQNFFFCNYTFSNETMQDSILNFDDWDLIQIAKRQQLSEILIISQSQVNHFTCQQVNITMEVGMVTLERAWFDPMLWELSDGVAVSKTSKLEWSNGDWNGTFPATISNFIVSKALEMTRWTDNPTLNASSILIYKQPEPKILAWVVEKVPLFPKLDSSFVLDEKMRNGSITSLEDIIQSVQNSSKSIYTEIFDPFTCCSTANVQADCPITLFKNDEETLPRIFQVIETTNQTSVELKQVFEENYYFKSQQFYIILVFLLLLIVFTFIWPCCSGFVLVASVKNTLLLKQRQDREKEATERTIQQKTLSRVQIVQATTPSNK